VGSWREMHASWKILVQEQVNGSVGRPGYRISYSVASYREIVLYLAIIYTKLECSLLYLAITT